MRSTKLERTVAVCIVFGFFALCVAGNDCYKSDRATEVECIRHGGQAIGKNCIRGCAEK